MHRSSTLKIVCSLLAMVLFAGHTTRAAAIVYRSKPTKIGKAPYSWVRTPSPWSEQGTKYSLEPLYRDHGHLSLSVDGCGTDLPEGVLEVDKPDGALVVKAFLAAASVGFSGYRIADGEISIDGTGVAWDQTVPNAILSWNVVADVTSLVADKIDASPPGIIDIAVAEAQSEWIDGSVLAVVFDDPNRTEATDVILFFGAMAPDGGTISIDLDEPADLDHPYTRLELGVGISFGMQTSQGHDQFSIIDVNGKRLTTAAGGPDDGSPVSGALISVGGLGDRATNPEDPDAPAETMSDDDELYDLRPFVDDGRGVITIHTRNPSRDENLFFASFQGGIPEQGGSYDQSAPMAAVDNGFRFELSHDTSAESRVGTEFDLVATLLFKGDPVPNAPVAFDVVSGPHSGISVEARTNPEGQASFAYTGREPGVDVVVASVEMGEEGERPVGPSVVLNEWVVVVGKAYLDVTPGFCPSPLFAGAKGTIDVALVGSAGFDVDDVDPSSLYLADVAPVGFEYRDVSRPGSAEDCACSNEGADGVVDLVLKFEVADVIAAIPPSDKEIRRVSLTGRTKGGVTFDATDCVLFIAITPDSNGGVGVGDGAPPAKGVTRNPGEPSPKADTPGGDGGTTKTPAGDSGDESKKAGEKDDNDGNQ